MNTKLSNLRPMSETVLMFLIDNLVSTKLIGFDYEDQMADHGDVVNVRIDGRKFQTPLTDWNTVSFRLDQEALKMSYTQLANQYLEPCGVAMAEQLDRVTLFWMAMRAGNRLGTPGGGFVMPELGRNKLILSRNASTDLLKSVVELTPADKERHDALEQATLSKDKIYVDQGCPDVTSDLGVIRKYPDDMCKVVQREEIGDMNLMFSHDSARLACRPLGVNPKLEQEVVRFNGLSLRTTLKSRGPDPETGECYDQVTVDMLYGVGVNSERTTVIYS